MDRELVLTILIAVGCGATLTACGFWPRAVSDESSDALSEPQAWRRLWTPLLPAALMLAALFGWAIREPAQAERVPNALLWCSLPFAAIFARAVWRALRALRIPNDHAAATVGLIRPRIAISHRLAAALDDAALAAALEHERAHARHRDPLRLWLAQVATDLLWPWPAAKYRLTCWRRSVELARDDEARFRGASGADLAAAIIASFRITPTAALLGVTAGLGSDEAFLKRRVAHLLRPLDRPAPHRERAAVALLIAIAIFLAFLSGTVFGERAVRALFGLP
jgi:BlaR1 peptidase M56